MAKVETGKNENGDPIIGIEFKASELVPGSDVVNQAITFLIIAAMNIEFDDDGELTEDGQRNALAARAVAESITAAAFAHAGSGE